LDRNELGSLDTKSQLFAKNLEAIYVVGVCRLCGVDLTSSPSNSKALLDLNLALSAICVLEYGPFNWCGFNHRNLRR
jgi:hypothetical protein